jgi:hypothetical protein
MIEMLETRRLLSALPVTHDPVEEVPRTIRVVTLDEFLKLETWNDDEIVVEWYDTTKSEPDLDDDGDEWEYELEEDDMSGDDDGVCDGPTEEPLDDEDFELVEEWGVLDEPMVIVSAGDEAGTGSFGDEKSIAEDVLGATDDEVLG